MCGIVGIFDTQFNAPVDHNDIFKMCDAIIHRGPDDFGTYTNKHVGIGMRRLSIIDVEGGSQPISNEDQTIWIVFNGEIYNHKTLRANLIAKGHIYKTNSDTETILHLYEEYDVSCLQFLRGMFCFIIWDSIKETFFIARDRLGIKPCFWVQVGSILIVASEMKSILALPWVPTSLDYNGLDAFFKYTFIPAPLTIYKDIKKLPPSHYLIAKKGSVSIQRYWDLQFSNKFDSKENELVDNFLEILNESVNIRLMSEVPLGAFLSGGIDSGLIVALMSQNMNEPVNAFNVKFSGHIGDFFDESPYARAVSGRYHTTYDEIQVVPQIKLAMDAAVFAFDEPFADDSLIPTYFICEAAKKKATVILTGLGGDENFAGYERYLGIWYSRFIRFFPNKIIKNIIAPCVRMIPESRGGNYRVNHLKRFINGLTNPPAIRYNSYISTLPTNSRKMLYSPDISNKIDFDQVEMLGKCHFERLESGDILDRALYQDINMYLPDDILALSDRIGMYHSLELRVPFVDHKLIEFCARVPNDYKIRAFRKKYLLRVASKNHLPHSVINHKKQGFSAPMASWLKTDLAQELTNTLSDQKIKEDGILNPTFIQGLIQDHNSRKNLNDKILFSLLMFQRWFQKNRPSID